MINLLKTLTANEFKIWYFIYATKNDNNIVFKKASDLMEELDISHKTMYDSLRKLRKMELIEVKGSKGMIKVLKEPE